MRIREHLALMGKGAIAVTGAGGVVGVIGLVQLLGQGPKHASVWIWIAAGFAIAFVAQIWAVQHALEEREAARRASQTTTQTAMQIAPAAGGIVAGVTASENVVNFGDDVRSLGTRATRRRRWSRPLSDEQREDLATRCEQWSREMIGWAYRPTSPAPETGKLETFFRASADSAEIARQFHERFAARARDLLHECAEAGYYFEERVERFRVAGIQFDHIDRMKELGEDLGVIGCRVRRGAKKLPPVR